FFGAPSLVTVAVTPAAFRRATLIRAYHNLRLADALHLAAAVEACCDRFLTADVQLQGFPDIRSKCWREAMGQAPLKPTRPAPPIPPARQPGEPATLHSLVCRPLNAVLLARCTFRA